MTDSPSHLSGRKVDGLPLIEVLADADRLAEAVDMGWRTDASSIVDTLLSLAKYIRVTPAPEQPDAALVERVWKAAQLVVADAEEFGILDSKGEGGKPISDLAMRAGPIRLLRAALASKPDTQEGRG